MATRGSWFMRDIPVIMWLSAAVTIALIHPFFDSSRWLMVHLVALGGFTHSIMVWSVHFTNALLKTKDVDGRRIQNIRLALLQLGMLAVFIGVPTAWWPLTVLGAVVISGVILWHAVMLVHRLRIALPGRFRISVRYYIVAATFFPIGALFGVLLARGLAGDWHGKLLVAHTMVNLLGWVGLSILGTLVTLWPTMLRTRMADGAEKASIRALPLLALGLTTVVVSPLVDLVWLGVVGVGIYFAGVVVVYMPIVQAARGRAPHSFPTLSASAALIWLPIALSTLAVKIVVDGWQELATSYGVLTVMFLVGFALQMLFGALSYLVPVVIGGGPRPLRAGMQELNRLGTWRVFTTNIAIGLCLLPVPPWVQVVVSAIALVALALTLVLILRAIFVMIRTKRQVAEEKAAQGIAPGGRPPVEQRDTSTITNPKVSKPQILASIIVVVMGAALGVGLDPAAIGLHTDREPVSESTVEPTGEVTEVEVTMEDMRFYPASVDVPAGNELVINLTNTDEAEVHDIVLANGVSSGRLSPGASTTVEVGVVNQDIEGWCSVVGHRQMGMVFDVNAIGGATADEAGAAADLDFAAPWPDNFTGYDPQLEAAPSGATHKYTFEVTEEPIEVAPGVEQVRWTFNGDSTGPTLRGNIGDTFEITLVNNGTMGHSIDFHASHLAPDEPMRTIAPGESLVYEFTANRAGIWMYHCGTAPMTAHIAAGMAGAVIIDPPDLDPVDHEFIMTQSELYLGEQGSDIDVDVDKTLAGDSDAVMFNGYVNQYVDRPLEISTGDRVRFWVLDIGPNRPLSFHIVGGQFDTVFKEGAYLLRDGRGPMDPEDYSAGGSQSLGLLPAQGGFVELNFPEAGQYTIVNHIMADAEHGATAIVEVTD